MEAEIETTHVGLVGTVYQFVDHRISSGSLRRSDGMLIVNLSRLSRRALTERIVRPQKIEYLIK